MRSATKSRKDRLTRWEILGAWLHVWTAPKDLEVPPVPWRKVALYGAATAGVWAVAALLIIPPLNEGKRKGEAQRAREEAAAVARERARLIADQKLHRLVVPAGTPLVAGLEEGIKADAEARVKAKKLGGPILSADCEPANTNATRFPDSRVYKCFVKTATGLPGQDQDILGTGYPFVATVYEKKRTVAWCKQNPPADEKGRRGATHVNVSPVCAGKLSEVL
jgi:hypothetical protein